MKVNVVLVKMCLPILSQVECSFYHYVALDAFWPVVRLVATNSKSAAVDFTEILPAGSGDRRVRVSEHLCLRADILTEKLIPTHPHLTKQ